MRALIGPDLLRKLPRRHVDIRDTKLPGFVLRCRPKGASYLVAETRGRWRTIGKVSKITPEAARATAAALLTSITKKTLALMGDDATLNLRDARALAGRELRASAKVKRMTWAAYLTEHYEPWVIEHRKAGAATVQRLRSMFAEFDTLLLTELHAFGIERWRTARLKAGISPVTVNRDFASLRGALSKAVEWGLLRDHPMKTVKASKVDTTGRVRFLSPDEERRLLDALAARDNRRRQDRDTANDWRRERGYAEYPPYGVYTDHLTPLVTLAMHTGCRRGELFSLRWADVDLAAARLTVRSDTTKSGKRRVIPLNTTIVKVLRDWRPTDATPEAHVFPGDDGERLVDVKTAFLKVLRGANVTGFVFHDLRHTFASKLVQAGVDLNTVRELLGHADLKMTLRYAHLAPEHKAAAVAVLA